jgi:hypothetical protein
MDNHIQAAQLMVSAHVNSETMLDAVNKLDGKFTDVTREHLMLIWIGINAKNIALNHTH